MLPFWTSYLIRTYAWMIILRDNGVLNSILLTTGLISDPIPILNSDFAVILGMTYGFLPFAILPMYVSIDRLDGHLVEAARDLFASGRGRVPPRHAAADDAGHRGRGPADVHPGDR